MKYLICFVVFFVLIYIMYYFLYVFKVKNYSSRKVPSDVRILESYYKVDVKKIGYKKVLRIMNFVNALMLSLMMLLVINLDKFIYKFLVIIVLMIPFPKSTDGDILQKMPAMHEMPSAT